MKITNQMLIISGRLIEHKTYGRAIAYGDPLPPELRKRHGNRPAEEAEQAQLSAAYRAKAKLRRLCFANAWQWLASDNSVRMPIFITYTFAENVIDPKRAHREFSKAMQRLNYLLSETVPEGVKYVSVPERQKRGALHYHQIVFNLPFIKRIYDVIDEVWGKGFTKVIAVRSPNALYSYLSKYLAKDLKSGRNFEGKRYFASRDLRQSIVIRDEAVIRQILDSIPADAQMWESESMPSEHVISIVYRKYTLADDLHLPVGLLLGKDEYSPDANSGDTVSTPIDVQEMKESDRRPAVSFNNSI